MRIFPKLLLILLLTSAMVLSLLYTLMQWSFDRGMLNYVNQRELQSMQLLSDNLASFYKQKGRWDELVTSSLQRPPPPRKGERPNEHRPNQQRREDNRGNGPREFRHREFERRPPPPRRRGQRTEADYWPMILALSAQGLHYPAGMTEQVNNYPPKQHALRISLLDKDKLSLIGRFKDKYNTKSILLNGEIVGYIALPPSKALTDEFDIAFVAENNQNIGVIIAGVFGLIFIITLPLSRHFVLPITKLKKAVVKLNKGELQTRLAVVGRDELATLARNFNDLAATLEQNEDSRKRWLADISHELRTPLAIVKGEIEAMEDGIRPLNKAGLLSLSEEVAHLQKLIDDLNELTNAEIGALRYQKHALDLTQLVSQNVERHQTILDKKGLLVHTQFTSAPVVVWADETRINQLLDNLLSNCLKYTDAPGKLFVTLTRNKQSVDIIIEDSAPAVPDSALAKLFEHLYRVESSRNRKTGGSGLGLALCKNIVHAHQGSINAFASPQGGLGIQITLPLN
ncbi:ATP-binding protein [Moritella dasanensis]|uniref:ATP-binding protein n=1 Tax=Moritella dasanensis TaxID=428031 RepID=UPI00035E450F|nr:ATP-binding protein [Moritella dasanensis]